MHLRRVGEEAVWNGCACARARVRAFMCACVWLMLLCLMNSWGWLLRAPQRDHYAECCLASLRATHSVPPLMHPSELGRFGFRVWTDGFSAPYPWYAVLCMCVRSLIGCTVLCLWCHNSLLHMCGVTDWPLWAMCVRSLLGCTVLCLWCHCSLPHMCEVTDKPPGRTWFRTTHCCLHWSWEGVVVFFPPLTLFEALLHSKHCFLWIRIYQKAKARMDILPLPFVCPLDYWLLISVP